MSVGTIFTLRNDHNFLQLLW